MFNDESISDSPARSASECRALDGAAGSARHRFVGLGHIGDGFVVEHKLPPPVHCTLPPEVGLRWKCPSSTSTTSSCILLRTSHHGCPCDPRRSETVLNRTHQVSDAGILDTCGQQPTTSRRIPLPLPQLSSSPCLAWPREHST